MIIAVINTIRDGDDKKVFTPNYLLLAGLIGLGKMGKDFVVRLAKKMKNKRKFRLLEKSIYNIKTTKRACRKVISSRNR